MSTNSTWTCNGCHRSWNRSSDLAQHYTRATATACLEAATKARDSFRHSRLSPRRDNPRQYRPQFQSHQGPLSQSLPANEDRSSNNEPEDEALPQVFQGDFFGNDYAPADFPGFVDDDTQTEDEGELDLDRDAELPELERIWEPARTLFNNAGDGMVIDEDIDPVIC
ncbi:hypothetical protein K435DRAFT_869892 [Dendrothele bispora CBS 962.96]|uniref:Uncharacterized protein n=1 Tax=Dendrothele bispora (strain CBS 962.96) TaxID=1314807 RepID=A0A4S8L8G7_DENBC|nr:hypothetical protein K435DRAFT_869892 [Dendrothele bispora CBS 962.96]